MKSLTAYIKKHNDGVDKLNQVFGPGSGGSKWPANFNDFTPEQKRSLANRVASDLSPESLYQDGERSVAKAMAEKARLDKVVADLKNQGVSVPEY